MPAASLGPPGRRRLVAFLPRLPWIHHPRHWLISLTPSPTRWPRHLALRPRGLISLRRSEQKGSGGRKALRNSGPSMFAAERGEIMKKNRIIQGIVAFGLLLGTAFAAQADET